MRCQRQVAAAAGAGVGRVLVLAVDAGGAGRQGAGPALRQPKLLTTLPVWTLSK